MLKGPLGFFLAFISLLVVMFVGEKGWIAGFIALAAWCFVCQFVLSRGNVDAYRRDWSKMLLVAALPVITVVIMILVERRAVILSQAPGVLLAGFGGTYAGAVAAAAYARRTAARR